MPGNYVSSRSLGQTTTFREYRLSPRRTPLKRLRRTGVRSGPDEGRLRRDLGGASGVSTGFESVLSCTDRRRALIRSRRFGAWFRGSRPTGRVPRTGTVCRSSLCRRRGCSHRCPEPLLPKSVVVPVENRR